MSELTFTPVHEKTGIALPVFITPEDFVASKSRQHHKEHPSVRPELQDYTGRALRMSATQQLPDYLHMSVCPDGYHRWLWGPENVPDSSGGKITRTLLHLAKVVPRQAIVLEDGGYEIKDYLTDDEHAFLSHPGIMHIEGRTPRTRQHRQRSIGLAILRYAVNEEIDGLISPKVREEFQRTLDIQREKELGNLIIRAAINEAIKPALTIYEEAKKEGMVDPRYLSLGSIVRNFVPNDNFGNFYEVLHRKMEEDQPAKLRVLRTEVVEPERQAA